jgi:hypothetical protein
MLSLRRAAHHIELYEPEIGAHHARFRWEVRPSSLFYEREEFTLSFPGHVDIERVPRALWWRVLLTCLYSHWAFLRPCTVDLPVSLGPGEQEFWMRMTETVAGQLEAHGSAPRRGRPARLRGSGPLLAPEPIPGLTDRPAVAFSGGKDSLTLTALLCELGGRPLLVTATSPVHWSRDEVGSERDHLLREIRRRLPVELVEVTSDYRSCWNPFFAERDGCELPVNQLTDLPFFQAVTMAVGAASGASRLFMASEADCQYSLRRQGRMVLHREFAGSASFQRSLDVLLSGFGLSQGSLTYPLHMRLVQGLLLRRYRELAELQFSCYQAPEGQRACGECQKCLQIAIVTLAEGVSPRELGIDPVHVLCAFAEAPPLIASDPAAGTLHETRRPGHQLLEALQQLGADEVAGIIAAGGQAGDPRLGAALAGYERMREEALSAGAMRTPGFIPGFLEMVDPQLRGGLRAILEQHYSVEAGEEFAGILERSQGLTRWLSEPL